MTIAKRKPKKKPDGRDPVVIALEIIILEMELRIMAQLDDLKQAIAKTSADVDALIAASQPIDLTDVIAQVGGLDQKVIAATPPAARL